MHDRAAAGSPTGDVSCEVSVEELDEVSDEALSDGAVGSVTSADAVSVVATWLVVVLA